VRTQGIELAISAASAALLVVDVQNDFCDPNGGCAKAGVLPYDTSMIEAMTPVLMHTVEGARRRGMKVVWIRTEYGNATNSPGWIRRGAGKPLIICRPGTWGADWYRVAPKEEDFVVTKHRYSGFLYTALETVLRVHGISTVAVAGVTTQVCVETTARDAFMRDFQVTVLSDCTASFDRGMHEASLRALSTHFGSVMDSADFFQLLVPGKATG
jgi:ureidoacrylate peracid hydrolase